MAVVVTGRTLTLEEVRRVARHREQVELAESTLEWMAGQRVIVERAALAGEPVYGLTTGVGMRREAKVDAATAADFNRSAIAGHRVGLGPPAREDVVRAALLCAANGLAAGYQGTRPNVAQAFVDALNDGRQIEVRSLGTLGQADLAQNADLAAAAVRDLELEAGEALALLASNAFSTGHAALGLGDASVFLEWCDVAGALDFEAFRANVGALHPEVASARPHRGVAETLERMRALLEGSGLWEAGAARFLQDPLTFRSLPQAHGAARDALRYALEVLGIELNAHQGNPLVVPSEGRIVSVGNFDSLQLAAALDLVRISLAPVVTSAVERTLKLLSPRFSGLAEGLVEQEGTWEDGLSELGVAAQAIAAEARLLAQPVSFELASTMQESGVEDRTALTSLGARRLDELLALGRRIVAVELVVAAQALDLRGSVAVGTGAASARSLVRELVPFLASASQMPLPLEDLAIALAETPAP